MSIIKDENIYKYGDPFAKLKKDFEELLSYEKELIKSNSELSTSLQQVKKSSDGPEARKLLTITDQLSKSTTKLSEVSKERIRLSKEKEKVLAKLITAENKQNETIAKGKKQLRERNELAKINAVLNNKLAGTEEKLIASNKKLRLERKKLNTETAAGVKRLNEINAAIDKNNAKLKQNTDTLTKQKIGIGKYSQALKGIGRQLLGAAGLIGGVQLLTSTLSKAFGVFTSFSKSSSKLAAILGTTKDQITSLTDQAKQLGATTAFTANEIIGLQTELAKLGFSTEAIEASTRGILDLAAATGSELSSAAELAGATLRIFNLDASEMQRVTDVLAKSTTISSLSMEKLATILPTVGKTAQIAGVSLEKTAALAGTLTDRGLDASSAATSLRNIFLELSKKGITWNDAMLQINNSTDKNKTSMDLFGKRAAAAGVILSETSVSTDELTTALEAANGAAKEMADTMLNNLAGDMTIAQSSWEGFILSLEDGGGRLSRVLRSATQWFTGLLEGLTNFNNGVQKFDSFTKRSVGFTDKLSAALKKQRDELDAVTDKEEQRIVAAQRYEKLVTELAKAEKDALRARADGQKTEQAGANLRIEYFTELIGVVTSYVPELEKSTTATIENTNAEDINNNVTTKLTESKRKLNYELRGQNKELDQLREELERIRELERRAEITSGAPPTTAPNVEGAGFDPLQAAVETTNKINEATAEAQEAANAEALQKEMDQQAAILAIKEAAVTAGISFANNAFNADQDERLAKIKDGIEAEKEALKDKLDKGIINETEYKTKLAALNKKERIAEAKAEKRKALFDIAIRTAVAAVSALPNLIKFAAILAVGGIQAAAVAAKPLPGFKEGVIGFKGKGTDTSDSNLARISNNESVITAKGTRNAPLALEAINKGLLSDKDIGRNIINPQPKTELNLDKLLARQDKTNLLLSNFVSSYENNDYYFRQMADGTLIKTPKHGN